MSTDGLIMVRDVLVSCDNALRHYRRPWTSVPITGTDASPLPLPPGATAMPHAGPSILLVSPDLMLTSRVAGLVASVGGQLETVSLCTATPKGSAFDLVLIDLGNLRPAPQDLLSQIRTTLSQQPLPRIVAFGPHVHKDRLQAALDAGADDAVSRGELLGDFASCIARWCSSRQSAAE